MTRSVPEQASSRICEPWTTSKCQRLMRPLKLKLAALDKTLLSEWLESDRSTARSDSGSVRSAELLSCRHSALNQPRKYGMSRKQAEKLSGDSSVRQNTRKPEDILSEIRATFKPAVGSAYLNVYYAFKTILDRVELASMNQMPSLASSAANSVGRCIYLTSSDFTTDPIESDDWYDSVPDHHRSSVMLGYAVELLRAASRNLLPLMPALILVAQSSSLSEALFDAMLDEFSLIHSCKLDMKLLKNIAIMIQRPSQLSQHYSKSLTFEMLLAPGFLILAEPAREEILDYSALQLYTTSYSTALEGLRRDAHKLTVSQKRRTNSVLEALSYRVVLSNDRASLEALHHAVSRDQSGLSMPLRMIYALSLLPFAQTDRRLITYITQNSNELLNLPSTEKDQAVQVLTTTFTSEKLVEVVETLVGRVDALAIELATDCSLRFEGDYLEWADGIEREIMEAKNDDNDKYRFEPLLNSWVVRTPGLKKVRHVKRIPVDDEEEMDDEEDDLITTTTNCHATIFAHAHEFSLIDKEAIISSPERYVHKNTQKGASSNNSSELVQSAKLLRKYHKLSSENNGLPSPLIKRDKNNLLSNSTLSDGTDSPLHRLGKKRLFSCAGPEAHGDHPKAKRLRGRAPDQPYAGLLADQFLNVKSIRAARRPLRELNNLKSSFAATRRNEAKTLVKRHYESESEDEVTGHHKSEVDELSML